jgi:hypothetical protein
MIENLNKIYEQSSHTVGTYHGRLLAKSNPGLLHVNHYCKLLMHFFGHLMPRSFQNSTDERVLHLWFKQLKLYQPPRHYYVTKTATVTNPRELIVLAKRFLRRSGTIVLNTSEKVSY